jgi:hypothetical protein
VSLNRFRSPSESRDHSCAEYTAKGDRSAFAVFQNGVMC